MTQNTLGTALVTGASSGIGAIYADRLASRGYDLILVARNKEKLQHLAAHITDRTGRAVEVVDADLGRSADVKRVEDVLRRDASVTLLVNNAGIGTHTTLLDSDADRMEAMIQLNVTALMRLTYAVVPGFVVRGKGAIINIASIVAVAPEAPNGGYGGKKTLV
ncbi:SDR family oxidoreductase, partial [Asaia sp. W19]|uniref:SDR family NAD(P)-dependent oxidoreductase n=1 Tax=Asaia sp. W19 TaxID=2067395 RepID=UPI000F8F6DF1